MKCLIFWIGLFLWWSLSACTDGGDLPPSASEASPIAISQLNQNLDHKEVTIKFTVSKLGGVAQLDIPGKAPTFIIEATSEHESKDLEVWIQGELADVLDRLQLSFGSSNQLKKGTIIVATGSLTFLPGAGDRKGHEWYSLEVEKWQNFRIVAPKGDR